MSVKISEVISACLGDFAISDIGQWPPDVFALTSALLEASGAYRLVVSPQYGAEWPPTSDWTDFVCEVAEEWRNSLNVASESYTPPPCIIENGLTDILRHREFDILDICTPQCSELLNFIVTLHAVADESCEGLGVSSVLDDGESNFWLNASYLLTNEGTLSRIDKARVRVVPKVRTPQTGITLRSLSHNLSCHRSEVDINWVNNFEPEGWPDERRVNFLIYPWPDKIYPTDFKEVEGNLGMNPSAHGFFSFSPNRTISQTTLEETLKVAQDKVGRIDALVMPETAIDEGEISTIKEALSNSSVPVLISGIRKDDHPFGQNYALISTLADGDWTDQTQYKHHRWCLDGGQIRQYHIASSLDPGKSWWESIQVQRRALTFVVANDWLVLCPLICEDLARPDPVAASIRSIGPSLVMAFLQDGPQMSGRWPGRYASVLADDPGSSVLTITSLGMSERSRPIGAEAKRTIALWKDSRSGLQEIDLDKNARAVVLTLCASQKTEYTADGRPDGGKTVEVVLAGIEQIC